MSEAKLTEVLPYVPVGESKKFDVRTIIDFLTEAYTDKKKKRVTAEIGFSFYPSLIVDVLISELDHFVEEDSSEVLEIIERLYYFAYIVASYSKGESREITNYVFRGAYDPEDMVKIQRLPVIPNEEPKTSIIPRTFFTYLYDVEDPTSKYSWKIVEEFIFLEENS